MSFRGSAESNLSLASKQEIFLQGEGWDLASGKTGKAGG